MKKNLLLIPALLLFFAPAFGQISILLVDDSDDSFGNVESFSAVLDSLGFAHSLFDAAGTATVPGTQDLMGYDLVIWHAASDGDSLAFWNRTDSDNAALTSYLSGGGNMWVIGTDLLYDRYGVSDTFSPGSFPFDAMGLSSYDVQSYIDDGGMGVAVVDPSSSSPINGLPQLDWVFSTLWYVDGVTPINGGGVPVYEMGDNTYVFDGKTCGVWFDNGSSRVLSFFFDSAQISSFQKHKDMTAAVLGFFSSQIVGISEAMEAEVGLFPNPVSGQLSVRFFAESAGTGKVGVYSVTGQEVLSRELAVVGGSQDIHLQVESLPAGVYLLKLRLDERSWVKKFIRAN